MNGIIDCGMALAGACVGAAINAAIYGFALYNPRPASPWLRFREAKRSVWDRVPIVGWFLLRRESATFGRGHWIRPLLIELACALALPLFLRWIQGGGLTACGLADAQIPTSGQMWIWFASYATLISLLVAATFIDFDEKTIPDSITLPGTVGALLLAWFCPIAKLPEVVWADPGIRIQLIHYASPQELPSWHHGTWGLVAAVAVVVVWITSLLPIRVTLRHGLIQGIRWMWLSLIRPPRKTQGLAAPRRMFGYTRFLLALVAAGMVATAVAWLAGGNSWNSYFSQLMGLAFGGGLVWAVRIIAGHALGQEAMGFGDVTLMAMIGAFLGWQPALLIFCFAPFAALAIAVFQMVATGRPDIAFGPYLSVATVFVIVGWGSIWNDWARQSVFFLGPVLLIIAMVCLVLMAVMLSGWQWIKQRLTTGGR